MADTNPDPSVPPDPALARQMKLESLKERIARADYAVDPDAVAEAVIRRMRFVRELEAAPRVIRRDARSPEPRGLNRPR
jgi:Anti-sigma-28 factor, FlgM